MGDECNKYFTKIRCSVASIVRDNEHFHGSVPKFSVRPKLFKFWTVLCMHLWIGTKPRVTYKIVNIGSSEVSDVELAWQVGAFYYRFVVWIEVSVKTNLELKKRRNSFA